VKQLKKGGTDNRPKTKGEVGGYSTVSGDYKGGKRGIVKPAEVKPTNESGGVERGNAAKRKKGYSLCRLEKKKKKTHEGREKN